MSGSCGTRSEKITPMRVIGIASTTPASGPAAPISNKALRLGINGDMRIKAPIVPNKNGAGMKYGSEAGTPWYRAAK